MTEPQRRERTGWHVTDYEPGDEASILALFSAGFGGQRTMRFWRWRFAEGPYGGPYAAVARRDTDRGMVGVYMGLPCRLCVGGRSVPAIQVVDLVVHPEYRKQGMFEAMAQHSYESFSRAGFRFEFAFPNPDAMSYPGFTRTLGWPALGELRRSLRRLDLGQPLERALRVPALARLANAFVRPIRLSAFARECRAARAETPNLRFATHDRLPQAHDALWDRCRERDSITLWKDAEYLRWRYDAHPEERFEYGCLEREGTVVAMAVTHVRAQAMMCCEFMVSDASPRTARRLAVELCLLGMQRGHRSVGLFGVEPSPGPSALTGFVPVRAAENVLVGTSIARDAEPDEVPPDASWAIDYGDADFV